MQKKKNVAQNFFNIQLKNKTLEFSVFKINLTFIALFSNPKKKNVAKNFFSGVTLTLILSISLIKSRYYEFHI